MLNVNVENIANKLLIKMNLEKNCYNIAYDFVKNYVESCPDNLVQSDDVDSFVLDSCINLYKNTIAGYNTKLKNCSYMSDKNISNIATNLLGTKNYARYDIYALKSLIHITIELLLTKCDPSQYSQDEFNNMVIEECKKLLNI